MGRRLAMAVVSEAQPCVLSCCHVLVLRANQPCWTVVVGSVDISEVPQGCQTGQQDGQTNLAQNFEVMRTGVPISSKPFGCGRGPSCYIPWPASSRAPPPIDPDSSREGAAIHWLWLNSSEE